jgi:cytidylate kinase
MGYLHIDTGAMYRAVTLRVLEEGLSPNEREAVRRIAEKISIRLERKDGNNRVFVDGRDVSEKIRSPEVTALVSQISSHRAVRGVLVREQRKMAAKGGVVLEGRDIGTVVLPNADLKIFMVADVKERARRRKKELATTGLDVDLDRLEAEIEERDRLDSTRDVSPLKKAADAVVLDTSNLTIAQQVDFIVQEAKKELERRITK